MALEDYIPNIFGGQNPQIAGLLGEEQAGQLQKQSNMAGLLGAAAALAQGMSPQGYRRSPIQNVLTALAAGYQNSAGAYRHGLQNIAQQQQFQVAADKQKAYAAAAEKYPDLAPLFRVAPEKAVEMVIQRERQKPIDDAYKDDSIQTVSAAPVSPSVPASLIPADSSAAGGQTYVVPDPNTATLPPVEVSSASPRQDPMLQNLAAQKERLLKANFRLSRLGFKEANDEVRSNLEQIKGIDEQIGRYAMRGFDVSEVMSALPADLKPRAAALVQMQDYLTPDQYSQRLESLLKDAQLKTSDIQEYQYAKQTGAFDGNFKQWVEFAGKSRATNVSVGDLSKETKTKLEQGTFSDADALTRLRNIELSFRPEYLNVGFRGKQTWNALKEKASSNALSSSEKDTLYQFSQYRQNAVTNLNQTIKDLTGQSMGVQEAARITSSLPNPGTGLFDGDSPTEFKAKMDNGMKLTKYALARKNYALKNGKNWSDISLDRMPEIINQRGKEIAAKYKLDPNKPEDKKWITQTLAAEFGISQ